ncbi:hypothetical protein [Aerosakkonema funiforme]|uniref:hypothetical protein n=1 Tax=Aerosakkonema funiforme TaxID=1246630 RepID=UPI0035BB2A8E
MSQALLVPIHLDALCLAENQPALRAMADYSKLPYIYQGDTHGTGQENLSEQILAPLFNHEFTLKAGIHLHLSLPDALTNGQHDETGTTFPRVPNRWLILRQGGDKGQKQWIIESDYLYPELAPGDNSPPPDAINILTEPPDLVNVDPGDANTYQYQRYRYMGGTWELTEWLSETETKEYAKSLTAIGTKETVPIFDEVKATFAAFYPNCHSVFGFYDPDYPSNNPPTGLQYDVIGWYSDAEQDCLKQFLAEHSGENQELLEVLQEEFNWTIALREGEELPEKSLYHGRITFGNTSASRSATERVKSLSQPTIAVANSAPEALSAYLAYSFSSDDATVRQAVEDKLNALQLSERLESRKLDIDAKFREGRHEWGFNTENEGFLWSIIPEIAQQQPAISRNIQASKVTIPTNLAQLLNELNVLQEAYNQAWLNIESMRRQLHSQWYYFMKNQGENGGNFYITINETSLIPLRRAIAQAGELEFTENTVTGKSLPFGIVSKLNEYFSYYVDTIQAATEGTFDDWADISNEFANCGVTLSDNRTVITIIEGESWEIQDNGQTYPVKVEGGIFTIYIPPTESQIAFNLINKLNQLLDAIATSNSSLESKYNLSQIPSQNYWRPNDPVILLAGEAAKSPTRFGQDGRLREDKLLQCQSLDFNLTTIIENIQVLQELIEGLKPAAGEDSINFSTWKEQPWNPFAFHWSVFAYPCRNMVSGEVQDYSPAQILDYYSLESNAIDLKLKSGAESNFVANANSYTGFSILTPSVALELTERLTSYLTQELLPDYYAANSIADDKQTSDYLSQNFQAVKTWYEEQNALPTETEQAQDPIFVALWAYGEMQSTECQAQVISGFNDTLLLAQPTLQLEIDDPISTDAVAKIFHEQVRWTLGNSLQYKILDGDIFNPIRSGGMSIQKLWLIDSFGQHKEVISSGNPENIQVVTTSEMTSPNAQYQVLLPPRLAQSARINFHWLAADALQEVQMTTVPARTPVCGWIVPNNLDNTLGIYDDRGKALGLLDTAGNWRTAPGIEVFRDGNDRPTLPNVHLEKMVHYLLDQGNDFQKQFISTLNNSLETIDPESFREHSSLALLVGRPIALVRATFSLEVKGLPGCDPTVKVESIDQTPATYGFTEVKFPIRLGDYQQLNDGLVGYWRETPVGTEGDYQYEGNIFYAPQSRLVEENLIQTEAEELVYFEQTVDAPPQGVTMLIDPRGLIHATSGILPNQELRLPPENYSQALKSIEVNFLSTPILCNQGEIALPLPQVPEYVWSWLSLNGETWSETETIKSVNPQASFAKPQQLYEGWLQLSSAKTEDSSSSSSADSELPAADGLQVNPSRTAESFQRSFSSIVKSVAKKPFEFRWYYEDEEEGELNGVLQIGNSDEVSPLRIEIKNILTEDEKDIVIYPISGATEANSDNYHFQLAFNTGILVNPENISLESEDWSIGFSGNSEADNLYLLWKGEGEITLKPNEATEVILIGVAAESAVRTTTTNVTISWEFKKGGSDVISVKLPGQNDEYEKTTTLELTMIKATGKSTIPLFVGFVGSNKVLNVNDGVSNLQLRITNTNLPNGEESNITFHYDSDIAQCSQLVVVLEVGTLEDTPWALGTVDQVNGVGISIDENKWVQKDKGEIKVGDAVKALQWTFAPKTADVVLAAQETMLISLSGIVTAHPTGEANLYLRYQYLPGYKDGQFTCQIEKAPLVFDDKNVGIGQTNPATELEVDGKIQGSELDVSGDANFTGNLNFGAQTRQMLNLYRQEYGIGVQGRTQYFRSAINFAWYKGGSHNDAEFNPGGGTVQMVIKDNGNVGIGNASPSVKLDVNGKIKGTELDVSGNASLTGALNFGSTKRQMINLWNTTHGIGIQTSTVYFRTDGNFAWYKGGGHNDQELNTGGGEFQMVINKDGNVGIGTVSPSAKLDVNGQAKINGDLIIRNTTLTENEVKILKKLAAGELKVVIQSEKGYYLDNYGAKAGDGDMDRSIQFCKYNNGIHENFKMKLTVIQ